MSEPLTGACACAETRYQLTSPPMFVHCCHCRDCQRQTGSAFVLNALIEADRVRVLAGEPRPDRMPTESALPHHIFRCARCGVAVWSEYGGRPEVRFVRTGTLDLPDALAPDVHIYTRSKLPWVVLPPQATVFTGYYQAKDVWPADRLARRRAAYAEAGR